MDHQSNSEPHWYLFQGDNEGQLDSHNQYCSDYDESNVNWENQDVRDFLSSLIDEESPINRQMHQEPQAQQPPQPQQKQECGRPAQPQIAPPTGYLQYHPQSQPQYSTPYDTKSPWTSNSNVVFVPIAIPHSTFKSRSSSLGGFPFQMGPSNTPFFFPQHQQPQQQPLYPQQMGLQHQQAMSWPNVSPFTIPASAYNPDLFSMAPQPPVKKVDTLAHVSANVTESSSPFMQSPSWKQDRAAKIERFKNKKRNFLKKIQYSSRKKIADERIRIKGRFLSKQKMEQFKQTYGDDILVRMSNNKTEIDTGRLPSQLVQQFSKKTSRKKQTPSLSHLASTRNIISLLHRKKNLFKVCRQNL